MKYESNILKRLIDTYGVVGNPRYISEIIKEFIVQGKERFPNLFTYQADWLAHIDEFGLNPSYTVSYTGQSIYAPNTLERPVKSAILKGQTLINLASKKTTTLAPSSNDIISNDLIKSKTTYTIAINVYTLNESSKIRIRNVLHDGSYSSSILDVNIILGKNIFTVTTVDNVKNLMLNYHNSFGTSEVVIDDIVIIEDNHANIDIPYFEGMQSVNMPVLTSSNEDGTKSNILTVNEPVELRGIGDVKDTLDLTTGELTERIGEIVLDGSQNLSITQTGENTIRYQYVFNDKSYGFTNVVSDILPTINVFGSDMECISGANNNSNILFRLSKEKATNVQECKQYLQQNPITVHYEHITPTVKTVGLNILDQNGHNIKQLMSFNGGTHFNTGSVEGSPLPVVSVSVETDLEETLKVCSLEGNTM